MVDFLRGNVPNSPDLFLGWAACASSWNLNLFVSVTIVMVPGSVVRGRVSLLISHSGRAFDATEILANERFEGQLPTEKSPGERSWRHFQSDSSRANVAQRKRQFCVYPHGLFNVLNQLILQAPTGRFPRGQCPRCILTCVLGRLALVPGLGVNTSKPNRNYIEQFWILSSLRQC